MSRTIPFPEQELDLQEVANECARRALQLEAGPIREVARDAAKRAAIRLRSDDVAIPTFEAVEAMRLDSRVLDALRDALGEERFAAVKGRTMNAIDNALCAVSNELAHEAIEERVRELSEPDGTPVVRPIACDH